MGLVLSFENSGRAETAGISIIGFVEMGILYLLVFYLECMQDIWYGAPTPAHSSRRLQGFEATQGPPASNPRCRARHTRLTRELLPTTGDGR